MNPVGAVALAVPLGRDFVAYREREPEASCVACHMEEVERRSAVDEELGEEVPVRKGRSHALRGPHDPEFLSRVFTAAWSADGAKVVLRNTGAGHRTPGLKGRAYTVRTIWLDAEGSEVGAASTGVLEATAALQPGEEAAWDVPERPDGAQGLRLDLAMRHYEGEEPRRFLRTTLEPKR